MRQTQTSDEYLTGPREAELVKKVLGDVFFDPYGHAKQLVRTRTMHTIETGNQPWPVSGPWFCNPPFSQSGEQIPRVADWVSKHKIDCFMLCLAAPGSMYWREAIWSKNGPQRIAWAPRLSFYRIDDREELVEERTLTSDGEGVPVIAQTMCRNPDFGRVMPTKQSISRDLAFMLWSINPVVIARFVREVTAYAKEANPKAASIGISLGGGPQP